MLTQSLVLLLVFLILASPAVSQQLDFNQILRATTASGEPSLKTGGLSNPLVGKDGKIYTCSGKHLFAFESNGSVAWIIPVSFVCNVDIAPIEDDLGKIYLIAEDRVLKIRPITIGSSESKVEVFFGPNSTIGGSGEIIGLSISTGYSSLYVTVKNRGLFAILLRGQLLWSAGPMLYRFGYRQGCKKNITDCYFNSAPVIDHCEGTLYMSNTEAQVYSLYLRSPHFRWIQDFSYIDKQLTLTAGNNGQLYVTFPAKGLLLSLDVSTGDVLWQMTVGPLASKESFPVVDSNGWASVGSLDGLLYSISPTGELKNFLETTATDSVVQVRPILDCSGFAVYVSQTLMETKFSLTTGNYTHISAMNPIKVVVTLLAPGTGTTYWTGKFPGELSPLLLKTDLQYFTLDERLLLALLASAKIGRRLQCYTTRQKLAWTCSQAEPKFASIYTGDEKAILLFVLFQFVIVVLLAGLVRFCCLFWRKKKLQDHGLPRFLEKRRSLRHKRKKFSRMISELEQQAAEEHSGNSEVLEQLGEVVKAKEGVERKLSTSYSLGRDSIGTRGQESLLPLYDGRTKSHSFHSTKKESVTIFNTVSDDSSTSGTDSRSSSCSNSSDNQNSAEMKSEAKGKQLMEARGSSKDIVARRVPEEGPGGRSRGKEELMKQSMQDGRRMWLKRRMTLSSSN